MKKVNLLAPGVAAGVLLLSPTVMRAGILNSPHDFSQQSWNMTGSDRNTVCSPCHQAHHADSTLIPLWGHMTTSSGFTMYNTNNVPASHMVMQVSPGPTGPSLACLSCHDGTVAVNQLATGLYIGGISSGPLTNTANLGTDLTHTHPISFSYDPSLVGTGPGQDQWLFPPLSTLVLQPDSGPFVAGNDMTINGFLLTSDSGGKYRVECSSCHDVHNQKGSATGTYDPSVNRYLLVINGTKGGVGSLLCRSCHNK